MLRGVVKGAYGPLAGDAPRIDTKRQIESRKTGNGTKRQVWDTILKRDTSAWDTSQHALHEEPVCDDPEGQLEPFQLVAKVRCRIAKVARAG